MPCFDRTDETKALWSQFQTGRNLLMLAPRRIGKTVLLNLVLETIAKADDGASGSLLLGVLNQRGEPIAELALRDLVDTLLADGSLVLGTDGRYRFMMHLLREWWLRYVVL